MSRSRIAALFLLPDCNLDCRFCGSDLSFPALSQDEVKRTLSFLMQEGYTNVVLGGGEPLLWKGGLTEVAQFAQDLGFVVQLNTNGISWPQGLEGTGRFDRIILPLDGATRASHDFLRSPRGGHRALIEKRLKQLCNTGQSISIGTVVCQKNQSELMELGQELAQWVHRGLSLHAWHLYRFIPIGRGGAQQGREDELGLTREVFKALCLPVQHTFPWKIYRRPNMMKSETVDFFWKEKGAWHTSGTGDATRKISSAVALDVESVRRNLV
jgi:MoaA/NifB/PqqE/SkfB family radical SAM enzyme